MDIESAARRIREDGYTVVPDFLGEEMLDGLRRDLAPLFDAVGSRMTEDYDGHYPIPRPHSPLIVNTLIALDPFTAENGATEIVPGSHRSAGPVDPDVPTMAVEMPAGALMLWDGAVWHRGGGNSTQNGYRRSINFNFNLAWLKQRENQFIGVPPEVVVEMPEKLQALIGYKLTNRGLGTVDYRNPIEAVKRRLAQARGS